MRAILHAADMVRAAQTEEPGAVVAGSDAILALGVRNALVLAWRTWPDVAKALLADAPHRDAAVSLFISGNDAAIARRAGISIPREARPRGTLSMREAEVHELVAQGLTNEEIAKLLYISISTTKVHIKHIFEKLGVRSRIDAARLWHEDRT